jgi:lipopolysaccharide export system permease protein
MRILTRYVLREFLTPVFYCILGFSLIYLVIELFGEFDKILQARPPATLVLVYLVGYLSPLVQWLLPASLLLGGLYAMWQLARHSEITAMRATGIGFGAITAPMLWSATGFAILLALNSEFYAPEGSRLAHLIKENRFKPIQHGRVYQDVPYRNFAERREWRISRLNLRNASTGQLRITWTDAEGMPQRVLSAKRAQYMDGVWWFFSPEFTEHQQRGGLMQTMPLGRTLDIISMPELTERPRDFLLELMQNDEDRENLSLRDMIRYVKARPRLTRDVKVGWRYAIYYRLVSPWSCLVITLFAIPAGVATGRQSVFLGVMMAVALFFLYYVLTFVLGGMAKKDLIPVGVGVLLPNLIFLAAGLILYYRQR